MTKKKILIGDDGADLGRSLGARLVATPFDVPFAVDSVSAVGAAIREKTAPDVARPGLQGGNGVVVMKRLRDLIPLVGVPTLVLSAREPSAYQQRAIEAGAQASFEKPVDINELMTAITTAVGGASVA